MKKWTQFCFLLVFTACSTTPKKSFSVDKIQLGPNEMSFEKLEAAEKSAREWLERQINLKNFSDYQHKLRDGIFYQIIGDGKFVAPRNYIFGIRHKDINRESFRTKTKIIVDLMAQNLSPYLVDFAVLRDEDFLVLVFGWKDQYLKSDAFAEDGPGEIMMNDYLDQIDLWFKKDQF